MTISCGLYDRDDLTRREPRVVRLDRHHPIVAVDAHLASPNDRGEA